DEEDVPDPGRRWHLTSVREVGDVPDDGGGEPERCGPGAEKKSGAQVLRSSGKRPPSDERNGQDVELGKEGQRGTRRSGDGGDQVREEEAEAPEAEQAECALARRGRQPAPQQLRLVHAHATPPSVSGVLRSGSLLPAPRQVSSPAWRVELARGHAMSTPPNCSGP